MEKSWSMSDMTTHHLRPFSDQIIGKQVGRDNRFAVFALEIRLYIRRRRLLHQAESKGSLLRTAFARVIQMA